METKKWDNIISELGEKLERSDVNYAFYLFEEGEDPICGTRLCLEHIAVIMESLAAELNAEEINSLIRYLIFLREIKEKINEE